MHLRVYVHNNTQLLLFNPVERFIFLVLTKSFRRTNQGRTISDKDVTWDWHWYSINCDQDWPFGGAALLTFFICFISLRTKSNWGLDNPFRSAFTLSQSVGDLCMDNRSLLRTSAVFFNMPFACIFSKFYAHFDTAISIKYNEKRGHLSGAGYTADKSNPSLCECSYDFRKEGDVNQGLD